MPAPVDDVVEGVDGVSGGDDHVRFGPLIKSAIQIVEKQMKARQADSPSCHVDAKYRNIVDRLNVA